MNGFEQRMLECPSLPRLPVGARLLTELIATGEGDTAAVLEVLECDAGLGEQVLRLITARHSESEIPSLARAAALLGPASLCASALSAALV